MPFMRVVAPPQADATCHRPRRGGVICGGIGIRPRRPILFQLTARRKLSLGDARPVYTRADALTGCVVSVLGLARVATTRTGHRMRRRGWYG